MRKPIDLVAESLRHVRFPARIPDDRSHKSLKHRYERRKVREYLRLGDWFAQA
jgi:hypothetical protein